METKKRQAKRAASAELLEVVRELVDELEPQSGSGQSGRSGRRSERVRLGASLGKDLGLDSLARAELVGRLEERFGVTLPERTLAEAERPSDLLRAVAQAGEGGEAEAFDLGHHPEQARQVAADDAVASGDASVAAREAVEGAATLIEVLDLYAEREPDRRHILYLDRGPGEGTETELTAGGLRRRAQGAAAALQAMGLDPGQAVGLMLPSGLDYFVAFAGVLMAGGVPVPLYPPMRPSQLEDHLGRQAKILDNARVHILVTFPEVKPLARLLRARVPDLERVVTAAELDGAPAAFVRTPIDTDDTAFLQYTSGSTGVPKGVVLSHRNLLSNLRSMGEILHIGEGDVVVSWLPLYHDMGLIGAWMGSLYFGVPLVLMSPLGFLSKPVRWLRAIHRYRGSLSAAPNFAYELCLAKVSPEEVEGLDLSSWRAALNGAEPVSPRSVVGFSERFASHGLRPEAMMPVYGLAESSLAVSFTPPDELPKIDLVDRETFQGRGVAAPASPGSPNALSFVCCGRPIPRHEVRFVDEDGREVREREQGRLQFRGPSATAGYFRNPEATAALVRGEWLDSGDLGYMAEGEIYLTGRTKDLIIHAGRNIYPQEIEDAVGDLDGVRRGCVAAFAARDEVSGPERLVVMAETRLDAADGVGRAELCRRIEETTMDLVGVGPDRVVLVPPHSVPKTSSGKLRRGTARRMVERGAVGGPGRAVWWQVARMAAAGVLPSLRSLRRRLGGVLYAVWFWGLLGLTAPPLWLAVWALPFRGLRRGVVRGFSRLLAGLTGTRIRVEGLEHLKDRPGGPWVITANHASYLDGFVLAAVLPSKAAYVVKSELRKSPVSHIFLSRIGCVFVERFDPARGQQESEKVVEALRRGDHLVIFPEGTLQRAPGLQPFRMGAFVVAARTGTPVVPVVVRGTRSKLRGGSWFPRPGDLEVVVRPPVEPEGEGWREAVRLRDRVREEMLACVGEPDLLR